MSKFAPMILIIDDDRAVCLSLELLLKRAGYEVTSVNTQADAIDYVRGNSPQLVLMDMNFSRSTSGDEGLILLRQVKLFRPAVPVILMTAWGSIPLAGHTGGCKRLHHQAVEQSAASAAHKHVA